MLGRKNGAGGLVAARMFGNGKSIHGVVVIVDDEQFRRLLHARGWINDHSEWIPTVAARRGIDAHDCIRIVALRLKMEQLAGVRFTESLGRGDDMHVAIQATGHHVLGDARRVDHATRSPA